MMIRRFLTATVAVAVLSTGFAAHAQSKVTLKTDKELWELPFKEFTAHQAAVCKDYGKNTPEAIAVCKVYGRRMTKAGRQNWSDSQVDGFCQNPANNSGCN